MSDIDEKESNNMPTKKAKGKSNGARPKRVAKSKREGPTKTAIAARLLQRQNGCTSKEVLEATGWPAVSMPAVAKAAHLKLKKEKEPGKPTRYYGSE